MTNLGKLTVVFIVVGVGMFVFGLLNFDPSISKDPALDPYHAGWRGRSSVGPNYRLEARLEASLGAMLVVGGAFLRRRKSS